MIPKWVLKNVEKARNAARLENAHFGGVHDDKLTYNGKEYLVDEFVKQRIHLYNETWIVAPLDYILETGRPRL